MSMLSAQCDELRSMAESVGLEMPQAATLMMEAADTILELHNKCADLVDERERLFRANVEKNGEILRLVGENANLREYIERKQDLQHFARLVDENSKLRKLVRDYEHCSMHADCDRCEYDGTTSTHCPLSPCFPDIDELNELGIEVNE